MTENKKPAIRFKGFTDDWEQRKLGDIVGIYDGVHQTPNYQNSGVMFLSVENIATLKSSKFISEEDFKRDYKVYPQENDILMTRIGDVGTTNVVTDNGLKAYYVSLALLKYKSTDPYFLSNAIQSDYVQKGLANRTLKTAIPMKINKDDIGKVSVMLPLSATEQQQIGTYFRNLDNLIALHQRNDEYLCKLNFSLKIEGDITFTNYWEQRKLDTITDVRDGTHDSPQYVETGHPFITSKNVKDGFINYEDIQYVSDKDYEEINKRSKVDKNDILMGMIGTIGNIALVRETPDFAIKNVALIKDIGDVYYRYLYHCLQSNSVAHQLDENLDGGTQKFIALNKIREIVIPVPSEHEQHKIGDYMESLDNLITLHQRELEKLQNIKKSMLEKMFV